MAEGEEIKVKAGTIYFDVDYKAYYQSGQVFSDCNSMQFINYGTAPVTIDSSIVLQQGQSWGISSNAGEITHKQFTVVFGTGTANLVVARKNYLKS